MPADAPNTTLAPSFFNGRLMVEIEGWNWALTVGLSHPSTPPRYRFQGGLMYTRGIDIAGRIRAPSIHRGKQIRIFPEGAQMRGNINHSAQTGEPAQRDREQSVPRS